MEMVTHPGNSAIRILWTASGRNTDVTAAITAAPGGLRTIAIPAATADIAA
jgi:hypothetical protein